MAVEMLSVVDSTLLTASVSLPLDVAVLCNERLGDCDPSLEEPSKYLSDVGI
jgi:hypothetical protein